MDPVVIIGFGGAAVAAAEAFRAADQTTPIIIVSAEPHYAYYRLRLSHLLGESPNVTDLLIHPPEWYAARNVEVLLGRRAESLDVAGRTVRLSGGETLRFRRLLLAQGSSAFVPPLPGADLPGVFTLRTVTDVNALYAYSRTRQDAVVIGGGVLGLEAAWALAQKGKHVHVVEVAPYLLPKQLDERAAALLQAQGEKAGLTFHLASEVSALAREDGLLTVSLKGKPPIRTEFVLFSIGVRPNVALAREAGLSVNRGVVVDEYMRTSAEDIYAAGDVAEYKGQVYGIWPVAKEQGKTAGLNLAGVATAYSEVVPSNYLRVFDTELFSVGDWGRGQGPYAVLTDYRLSEGVYRKVCFKEGKPVGAILCGATQAGLQVAAAIKAGWEVPAEVIQNGDFEAFLSSLRA
ncbi:MAG TPA: NAD(P)/FAD-dependent oxidoreductase [Firmicutes bacterium]|nr:NAD(P)/FAD-dependent oxidoreductase [Bacillota bacterium]